MKWTKLDELIQQWKLLRTQRKIIWLGFIFIALAIGSILLINFYGPLNLFSTPGGEFPSATLGIRIRDDEVYVNGTVQFTVYCYFESYKDYPPPEGELYQITKVFVCTENHLKEFNASLGEVLDIANVNVLVGSLDLAVKEEVSIQFQTFFPLETDEFIYVGVLANDPTGFRRWDRYTKVLPSLPG